MEFDESRLGRLEDALGRGGIWINDQRLKAQENSSEAAFPRASSAHDVRKLSEAIRDELHPDDPNLWPDEAVCQTGEELGGEQVVATLLEGPEFEAVQTAKILIDWSVKPLWATDGPSREPSPAQIKAISRADREGWRGEGLPPDFRLTLSLPWWMLANRFEREAGLHDRLAYMAFDGSKPYIRKRPDIAAMYPTLGRYGLLNAHQITAFAYAASHPTTPARLRAHHFGPTGQGCLFGPAESSLDRPEDRPSAQEPLLQPPQRTTRRTLQPGAS